MPDEFSSYHDCSYWNSFRGDFNASIDYPYDVIEGYNNLLEIIKEYGQKRNSVDSNKVWSAG